MDDPLLKGPQTTPLEDILGELSADSKLDLVTVEIPRRSGWQLVLDPNLLDVTKLQHLESRAKLPGSPDQIWMARWAGLVLQSVCIELKKNEAIIVKPNGAAVKLSDPEFKQMFRRSDAWEAVMDLFIVDGDAIAAAKLIPLALGLGSSAYT